MNRKWRPPTWSEQAREMSNDVINNVNKGRMCLEEATRFFILSYRAPIIHERAAKRFGRWVRAGKVHETPESKIAWAEYKEKYNIGPNSIINILTLEKKREKMRCSTYTK